MRPVQPGRARNWWRRSTADRRAASPSLPVGLGCVGVAAEYRGRSLPRQRATVAAAPLPQRSGQAHVRARVSRRSWPPRSARRTCRSIHREQDGCRVVPNTARRASGLGARRAGRPTPVDPDRRAPEGRGRVHRHEAERGGLLTSPTRLPPSTAAPQRSSSRQVSVVAGPPTGAPVECVSSDGASAGVACIERTQRTGRARPWSGLRHAMRHPRPGVAASAPS